MTSIPQPRRISARLPLRSLRLYVGLSALTLSSCATLSPLPPGYTSLFDGHSLSNWTIRGGHAPFTIESGAIVGTATRGQPNTFLCTNATYSDFILELDFLIDHDPAHDTQLNSGVQIRSHARPDGVVYGYQVEIDPSKRAWTAGIYEEAARGWLFPLDKDAAARAAFRQSQWNHIKVVASGDHIQTWLNGVAAADLHDSTSPDGFIGLQVHQVAAGSPELHVRFRNIMIKPLPDPGT